MASNMLARGSIGVHNAVNARRASSQLQRHPFCAVSLTSQPAATAAVPSACASGRPADQSSSTWASTREQQQRHKQRRWRAPPAAAAATASVDEAPWGPSEMAADVADMVAYAVKLAWTSETYQVHSWMVLLGLLRNESCTAAGVLTTLGLDDLYGAWHEVLWALNVSDGLEPRAFTAKMEWGRRAYRVVHGSMRFAKWAGRERVQSEDLLLALAADNVFVDLFPDLDLGFDRVKREIERATGGRYELPGYEEDENALASSDMFL